jgi:hypothetical protein
LFRRCANLDTPAACNWLLPALNDHDSLCVACSLNAPSLTFLIPTTPNAGAKSKSPSGDWSRN